MVNELVRRRDSRRGTTRRLTGPSWVLAVLMACATVAEAAPPAADRPPGSIPPPPPRRIVAIDLGDSTLDLERLERAVLERNPTLAAARAAVDEARARADRAGALEPPMLDAMVAPRSLGSDNVDAGYRIGLTQRLPLFGQRGLERRASREGIPVAEAQAAVERLELLSETRAAFFQYYRVARARQTNEEQTALVDLLRRSALARYSAGTAEQSDPLQAEVERAMLEHDAAVLERERIVAEARINTLLHRAPADPLPDPPSALSVPDSIAQGVGFAIAVRPELRMAAAEVEVGRVRVALAKRERLPMTAFGAAYDRFWTEPELRGTVSVSIDLPLDQGRRGASVREAEAALRNAELRREALEDRVRLEVRSAVARLQESRHEVEILRDRLMPVSERALRAARVAYEANRGSLAALLDAARAWRRARLELHHTLATAAEAHADLERALGTDHIGGAR
ncbi:MAG TPA: TolC family protein [Candidatus Limnocylindria bacterium]|nr:TolC family protein [Candidatus Limnocylindria bacterium]